MIRWRLKVIITKVYEDGELSYTLVSSHGIVIVIKKHHKMYKI